MIGAVMFGSQCLAPCTAAGGGHQFADLVAKWDGRSYAAILSRGYEYDQGHHERIAFFPAFPLIGKVVVALTGWRPMFALFVVAQTCLAGAFLLVGLYARRRGFSPLHVGLAMAVWPPTMFLRMAYTEAMFVLLVTLFLLAIRLRWNVFAVAAIVAVATATRSVGVGLIPPLVLYAYGRTPSVSWTRRGLRVAMVLPVAMSGVLGYMAFQQAKYHDAFAFVKIQDSYRMRPRLTKAETAIKLATLEPLRAAYDSDSDGYWAKLSLSQYLPDALFNIYFWNPIYFCAAVVAVIVGACCRLLDRHEVLLAAGLLLILYVTRGYDFGMCRQARFTVVCAPIYLVLGTAVAKLPEWLRHGVVLLAAFHLMVFAALFAAGYPIF